jgi:DNA polymerase-1
MNFIGFDIETRGALPEYALQAYRAIDGQAHISAASIGTSSRTIGMHNPTAKNIEQMLSTFTGQYIAGWNVCFDVSWLYAVGVSPELIETIRWIDAMLLWNHLAREPESETTKKKSYSLKSAMLEFYPDHAEFKDFEDFQNNSPEALAALLHRNKEDARYTAILAEQFWSQLEPKQRQAALIEARCIPMVALTYVRGLQVNSDALSALRAKLETDAVAAYQLLKDHYPAIDDINLGSPKQVGWLLYEYWNLHPPKINASGTNSTDKFALHALAETYPQAKSLRDYRESQYNLAKYVTATEASIEYNGESTTRPQAKIFGTYTGRMTYYSKQGKGKSERPTGIALHQWKRGADFRNLITAPEGYSLIELDFAGQEFGLMAVASGDEKMLELRADGEDAHAYMGAQIAKVDYKDLIVRVKQGDKEAANQRKLGKFANLSFQYRIGAKAATTKAKVEYGLDLSEAFVQSILNTYKSSYPGVPKYWIDAINKSRSLGYAETFAGRRVQLTGQWMDKKYSWALESTAINYPIQGTGGDQKYLALAVARQVLPEMQGYFYYELHDGLFFILPEETAERDGRKLRYILSNLPYKTAWGVDFPISFPVDLKIGPSWGQLQEVGK